MTKNLFTKVCLAVILIFLVRAFIPDYSFYQNFGSGVERVAIAADTTRPAIRPTSEPTAGLGTRPPSKRPTTSPTASPTAEPTATPTNQPTPTATKQTRRLCPVGDKQEYTKGRWLRNTSIGFRYTVGYKLDKIGPMCTAREIEFLANGTVPKYLQYQWQPQSCDLASFDKENFCRLMDGKKIGVIGDSMMEQFAQSLRGLLLAEDMVKYWPGNVYNYELNLCAAINATKQYNVAMRYIRSDYSADRGHRYVIQIANASDYLIMNWGAHFLGDEVKYNSTVDLIRVLEEHWDKKPERIFWRSTIVSHANCNAASRPDDPSPAGNISHTLINREPRFNAHAAFAQDEKIVKPLFQNLSSPLRNITFLQIEASSMLRRDGHRIIGQRRGSADCLHYCQPGPPDHWVELFYHHIVMGI